MIPPLVDSLLLTALVQAVVRQRLAGTIASEIAEEARRRLAAGEGDSVFALEELSRTLIRSARLVDEGKTEEAIQREYAELARERAALRRLARESIRELEAVQQHDGEAPSTTALLLELKGAVN